MLKSTSHEPLGLGIAPHIPKQLFESYANELRSHDQIKEEVVKKLFDAFDKLLNAPTAIPMARSLICFNMKLDPLKYVDEREFQMGVYDPLIDSFHQTYIEKWKKDIEEYYGY